MRQRNPRAAKNLGGRPPAPERTLSEILRTGARRAEAAKFFDVTPPTIDGWAKQGAPRLGGGLYPLRELARWRAMRDALDDARIEGNLSAEDELKLLRKVRRQRETVHLHRDIGKLLPRDSVIEQLGAACRTVRIRLEGMKFKIAPMVIACRTLDEAEEVFDREVAEILEAFRRGLDPVMLEPALLQQLRDRGRIEPGDQESAGALSESKTTDQTTSDREDETDE